jgi:hypothetical protein
MKGFHAIIAAACTAALFAGCAAGPPVVSPDQVHGVIVSQAEQRADHTHPVRIVAINGSPIPIEHRGPLYVTPGLHTVRLSPLATYSEIRDVRRGRRQDDPDAYVDINVQPGMRYVVAARETGDHLSEWRAVVTRVEVIR